MGCGKTTLGRAVARCASMSMIDLDEYIQHREGMTVRQIFDIRGEDYFRLIERESLLEISRMTDVVVATGGGTPCQPGLMDIMLETGITVFLVAPLPVIYRRLREGRTTRPLIANLDDNQLHDFIIKTLDKRMPHYTRAAARFDSSHLETPGEIATATDRFIRNFIINEETEIRNF